LTDPSPNPLLDAALAYAARGWRVVPLYEALPGGVCACPKADCGSPGKHPRTKHGLTDGTADPDAIRGWWARWPRANVGVVCGPESGVWMVGPDGEAGVEDFRRLAEANGPLPETATARSGSGGMHWYFRYPADGRPIRNRKKLHGTNIDVRAHGETGPGYFVAPPSVNDKGRYEWVDDRALADAPDWLVAWAERDEVKPERAAPARPQAPAGPTQAELHKRAVRYLDRCPEAVSGQRGHDALFWAARAMVWGFALPENEALGLLATYYNPRCRPAWAEKELTHKVREAGARPFDKPRGFLRDAADADEAVRRMTPPTKAAGPAAPQPWQVKPAGGSPETIDAAALMGVEYPPIRYAFDGLITEGMSLLCGKSKQGKSWLSLLLALAVAAGEGFDGRGVHPGEVLYLALEDTRRRLQHRLRLLAGSLGHPIPAALTFGTTWPKSHDGGLYYLAEWLEARKGAARLVVIDTLGRFRSAAKTEGFQSDYDAMAAIKGLLDAHGVSGLVLHHVRKLPSEDPFDAISGTNAIGAAADTMLVLDRKRGTDEARLYAAGRDAGESTTALTFDGGRCRWVLGERADGINTDGFAAGGGPNKLEQCAGWLRTYLADYAYPSDELKRAAEQAGFTFSQLRDAKTRLGRDGTGELSNHNFEPRSKQGDWWSGLGHPENWRRRPAAGELAPQSRPRTHRKDVDLPSNDEGF
jgi:hypothetical protein